MQGNNFFPNNNRRRTATILSNPTLFFGQPAPKRTRFNISDSQMLQAPPVAVQGNFRRLGKRPIDKALISVSHSAVDAVQKSTILATTSNPCTITGLRWFLNIAQTGGSAVSQGGWAIVVVRDGNQANTLNRGNGATFYAPEQDVLTFGSWVIDNNTETANFVGDTKTMRKMLIGDRLIFIVLGVATQTADVKGIVQFFCKS